MNVKKIEEPKGVIQQLEALKEQGINYAVTYHYDRMRYSTIEEVDINWETLIEARLFGECTEIYIFKQEGQLKAVQRTEDTDQYLTTTYLLNTHSGFKRLAVKKYIQYDKEDGQAYIAYVRPYYLI